MWSGKKIILILISIIEVLVAALFVLKSIDVLNIDFVLINFPTPIIIVNLCATIQSFIIEKDKKIKKLLYVLILFFMLSVVNYYLNLGIINDWTNAILGAISLFIMVSFSYKVDKQVLRFLFEKTVEKRTLQ